MKRTSTSASKYCIYCRSTDLNHDWRECYDHMLTLDKYFHKPHWCCFCGGYHKSLEHNKLMDLKEEKKKRIDLPWWVSFAFFCLVAFGVLKIVFYALQFISTLAFIAVAGVVLYILFTIARAKLTNK